MLARTHLTLQRHGTVTIEIKKTCQSASARWFESGAGDGIRTRDINLGKVALYQLSYSRPKA